MRNKAKSHMNACDNQLNGDWWLCDIIYKKKFAFEYKDHCFFYFQKKRKWSQPKVIVGNKFLLTLLK